MSSLAKLVVEIAAKMSGYKADMAEAATVTQAAASKMEASTNGVTKANENLQKNLEDTRKKAQEGQKATNDASKAIDKQIEALRTQAATFSMSAAQAQAYKLAQEGASQAQIAQANAVQKSIDSMQQARDLGSQMGTALKAGAIAAATGAIAAAVAFEKLIGNVAKYQDMAEQNGADPAGLASLRTAADVGGTSIESLVIATNRMSKSLAAADDDSKGVGRALGAIGIEVEKFKAQRADEQLRTIAKAMNQYADSGAKAAVIQDIMGRGTATMLPALKELGNETEIHNGLTTEQIKLADDYKDAQARARSELMQFGEQMAVSALPVVTAFTGAVHDTVKELFAVGGAGSKLVAENKVVAFAQAAGVGLAHVADLGHFVGKSLQAVGLVMGAVAAKAVALAKFDFAGADVITKASRENLANLNFTLGLADKVEARFAAMNASKAAGDSGTPDPAETQKELDYRSSAVKATRLQVDVNAELIASVRTGLAASRAEMELGAKLTPVQREIATLYEKISTSKKEYTLETLLVVDALMQEKLADEAGAIARQKAEKATEALEKANLAAAEAHDKYVDGLIKGVAKSEQELASLKEVNDRMGLSKTAIAELDAAKMEDQAITLEGIAIRAHEKASTDVVYNQQKREVAILRERAALLRAGALKAEAIDSAKAAAEAWNKTADSINQTLTDALMRGFENGKGFAENLRDTVVNMFKTMVLRPVISAVMNPVAQTLTGALGMSSMASAASGVSAAGSTGMLAGLGSGVAGFSQAAGATMSNGLISGFGANMGNISALASGGSYMTALGAAMPYLGVALAIGSLFSGGGFKSSATTGETVAGLDSTGSMSLLAGPKGRTAGSDAGATNLANTYAATAASLGIKTRAAEFFYGGNTGAQGENPNFALSGGVVGTRGYAIGETAVSDAAIQTAASRAVFAALQASELPDYLAGVFDGMDAATMSKDQIDAALANAQQLKAAQDASLAAQADWQTRIDVLTGKTTQRAVDLAAALKAADDPTDKLIQSFYDIESAQIAAAEATAAMAKASAEAAVTLKARAAWQDKLDVLTGKTTSREIALRDDLASTTDAATKALIAQVYAQEDLAAAAEAAESAAATVRDAWAGITDSIVDEVQRLRGEIAGEGPGGLAAAQSAFDNATARARAGDQEAAKALPALSRTLEQLAGLNAGTLVELKRSQARTASSLSATGSMLGGFGASAQVAAGGGAQVVVGGGASAAAAPSAGAAQFSQKVRMPGGVYSDIWITDPAEVARLTTIRDYTVKTFDGSAGSLQTIAAEAAKYGVSQAEIANAMGYTVQDIAALFGGAGIPSFDVGTNFVPRDMLAMVHRGEEIRPAAWNPATAGVSGGGNGELVLALVRGFEDLSARVAQSNETLGSVRQKLGMGNGPVLVEAVTP